MAPNTPLDIQNLVIYEIFTRNHSLEGTFARVEVDLDRIHNLGIDVIWFMPIRPIGKVARKGSLGSPSSIRDYRAINPEYGSQADFQRLVKHAHALGLKIMLDIVFNHTAHDALLVREHPEWYHQDEKGIPLTTVPAWSDVIDLLPHQPEREEFLCEILCEWVRLGVDGFRCDVASIIPVEFWLRARERVAKINPEVIWLAESVHASFITSRRLAGLTANSDAELYQAFDLTYDYDIWPIWEKAVKGQIQVSRYLEMLRFQDSIYPAKYIKLRAVENHDRPRILDLAPTANQALAWTAFEAFNKGAFLIYAGQESSSSHTPSLFDKDPIDWQDYGLQDWLKSIISIKKDPAVRYGRFVLLDSNPAIQATWVDPQSSLYGIFNVSGNNGEIQVRLPDGKFEEILTGKLIKVQDSSIPIPGDVAILRYRSEIDLSPAYSPLIDEG